MEITSEGVSISQKDSAFIFLFLGFFLKDFTKMLELEEEHVRRQCDDIIALKPDVIFTEKGVSDLAQHFLLKAGKILQV